MSKATVGNQFFVILEPLLKELFQTDDGEALLRNLSAQAFEDSPRALDERYEDLIRRAAKRPDLVIKHQAALMRALAIVQAVQEQQRAQFRNNPLYVATVDVLRRAIAKKGSASVYALARPLLFLDPTRVVAPAKLSVLAEQRPELPFDQWSELLMREFTRTCETALKTTLTSLLGIVNDRDKTPQMIGQLISECQVAWKNTPLLPLVNPEIAWVRNAISHEDFEISLSSETITFNHPKKDGTIETIGPWTRETFESWVRRFTELLLDTSSAFLDVLGEMRDADLVAQGIKVPME